LKKLAEFEEIYREQKEDECSWLEFSLEERRDLFLKNALSKEVSTNPEYALKDYIKAKHLFFEKLEYDGSEVSKFIEMLFVFDNSDRKVKCLFLFNKEGYIDDKGYENFENLEIYEISVQEKKINMLDMESFIEKSQNNYENFLDRAVNFHMAQEGKAHVQSKYDEEKNIIGYVRHILKDDKFVSSDKDGNILE
jgi:hypothetical protein